MIGTPSEIAKHLFTLDKDKQYEIKPVKKKRSLDANSYAWKLITEIGNVLRKSKDEVYLDMLKHYGQILLVPIPKGENPGGYFKYYEFICESVLNGKEADYYKVFKGSSEFDNKEMSILIDGIKQECDDLGINTLTPKELSLLKESWGKNEN